ncbi:MAG: rRNA pseudouridine synthase [Roseburia sp.]|nr:rRNA pseudouridine synthase [Anaeroplasma bactoclasticum]MCM1197078.1 rRNA pseudouridine synthase [Roseburia sp.]MCM1557694.1 rRNA pseudouridine synthase [Anaeroplasma bactoclasticum]
MRLDKLLAHMGYGSRKEVKTFIRKGYVLLNGEVVFNDDIKVDEENDEIVILDQTVEYQKQIYLLLNKPKGYVSATFDSKEPTVLDLIEETQKGLFPVGRLDKDTTGLLLITNDGKLAHELLSPKHHVAKTYELTFFGIFKDSFFEQFKKGIVLEDGYNCKPAEFILLEPQKGRITIYEGKFHQIKRMMHALGMEVTSLKRLSFGNLELPLDLEEGTYRALTKEELDLLRNEKS